MSDDDQEPLSRGLRTPTTEAASALMKAADFWCAVCVATGTAQIPPSPEPNMSDAEYHFFAEVFGGEWDNPEANGDAHIADLDKPVKGFEEHGNSFALLHVMFAVVSYAVQAMKEDKSGPRDMAWSYAADAKYWAGILCGAWSLKQEESNPAKAMAALRHRENLELRKYVVAYWRENIDPKLSAQAAATEILRKNVVALAHRTIADAISAAKKDAS